MARKEKVSINGGDELSVTFKLNKSADEVVEEKDDEGGEDSSAAETIPIENGKLSKAKWGDIDHGADGQEIKEAKNAKSLGKEMWAYFIDPKSVSKNKLEHHTIEDGALVPVEGGIKAAEAAVLGSRGGVNISGEEKKAALRHLLKHMRAHDIEPAEGTKEMLGLEEEGERKRISVSTSDEFSKLCHFTHKVDIQSDSITMHYGVKVNGGHCSIDSDLSKASLRGPMMAGNGPEFRPTSQELEIINSLANRPYAADELKVFYTVSADDQVDSHGEHFGPKARKNLAKMAYDQPVMNDHNYYNTDGVFAKIFDGADVKGPDGVSRVRHKIYMLDTPEFQKIIQGFESGINNKLSVGVRIKRSDYICDACNAPMFMIDAKSDRWEWCGHYVGQAMPDGSTNTATIADIIRFLELSRVTVPAQAEAAVKSKKSITPAREALKSLSLMKAFSDAAGVFDSRNSIKATISSDVIKGDHSVDDKEKKDAPQADATVDKKDAPASAEADAAKAANEAPAADEALTSFKSALEGVFKALQGSVEGQSESNIKLEGAMTEVKSLLVQVVEVSKASALSTEAYKKELSEREEMLKKQISEARQLISKIGEAHLELATKVGIVVEKSDVEIARMVAAQKSMPNRREVEADHKAKNDPNGYYESAAAKFV